MPEAENLPDLWARVAAAEAEASTAEPWECEPIGPVGEDLQTFYARLAPREDGTWPERSAKDVWRLLFLVNERELILDIAESESGERQHKAYWAMALISPMLSMVEAEAENRGLDSGTIRAWFELRAREGKMEREKSKRRGETEAQILRLGDDRFPCWHSLCSEDRGILADGRKTLATYRAKLNKEMTSPSPAADQRASVLDARSKDGGLSAADAVLCPGCGEGILSYTLSQKELARELKVSVSCVSQKNAQMTEAKLLKDRQYAECRACGVRMYPKIVGLGTRSQGKRL